MKDLNFEYPIPLLEIPTAPAATRETNHNRIRNLIPRAAEGVENFNLRVLDNPLVTEDIIWIQDAHERLTGMNPEGFDRLNLPAVAGQSGLRSIIQRISKSFLAPWMLHPPLTPILLEEKPPTVPVWAGGELRNPFLEELDKDVEAVMDRQEIEARDPRLAEFLKIQAKGGPSFRELYQAQEDLRLAKAAREYRGANPFDDRAFDGNESERAMEIRRISDDNRILAQQLKAESTLTGFNPFEGIGENMTRATKLFKVDISLAYLLDNAGRFRRNQEAAELAEIEAQKRANEAEIARRNALRGGRVGRR